jgi:hypothetical protein
MILAAPPDPTHDPNDVICEGGEYPELLLCDEVIAVCTALDIGVESSYGKKIYFHFEVLQPEIYAGCELEMYANYYPRPRSKSKIMTLACIATGRRRISQITKSMFVGKTFRCELAKSRKGSAAYSVIKTLLEKIES